MIPPRIVLILATAAWALAAPAAVSAEDPLAQLVPEQIGSVQILLNAGGVDLGYTSDIRGDDPAVRTLIEVIHNRSELAQDHKCSNLGAIRFHLRDGTQLALGLLPGHTKGFYELRFYRGGTFVAMYRIDRSALLAGLSDLGVPVDNRAFVE